MIESLSTNLETAIQSAPLVAIGISMGAGILTSFTPCVYPLIPITIGFIGAKGSTTKMRGFYLSLMYVFGLAIVYAALGAFAALTGKFFGQIQTNPWMHIIVANMCIIFGLAMLDVFTIQFTWFSRFGITKTEGKGGLTALIIGGSSALISGPCTAPVLAILLTYVGTKQNVLFGVSMLFSYALGMGFLLIIIGTFTGLISSLPKSGQWMVRIKKAFGFLMIAVGQYFLVKAGQFLI